MSATAYRLPREVWPTHYAVELFADPAKVDFHGWVTIDLDIREPVASITMHARGLSIADARVAGQGGEWLPRIVLSQAVEAVTFELPQTLAPGPAVLSLSFSGQLSQSMHGLYLATDGKDRVLCTQCEATDARAIFPCFDEPEFKASLSWTLHAPAGAVALANGPLVSTCETPQGTVHRFAATPPISSYLAALVVGELEGSPTTTVGGTPVRVFAAPGKLSQTRFAHGFTERLLPFYEEYFECRYPYSKYDQVAVPGFDAGAMENVGLVLFRQNLLLMDPDSVSWHQEKTIANVIAHEMAHMWFGNLVTMRWWDDLWLNEAFAEWMAHKAVAALAPDYLIWDDFQQDKNRAMVDDALPTTRAIWTEVSTPEQAIEMFDAITYQKGCAVMRMLESYLGEGPFRDGLRRYIREFANRNATGEDLWRALGEASAQPVPALMRSWISQPGFPVIDAELVEGPGGAVSLRLLQRRFYSAPRDQAAPCEQLWSVPMVLRFEDDAGVREHRFILDERAHEQVLPALGLVRWCYPNQSGIGFYRLNLGVELAARLLDRGVERLVPAEQMGFLEDQWALVRNGSVGISPFLKLLERFARIEEHNVLRTVLDRLDRLDLFIKDSTDHAARERFRAWVRGLFEERLSQLGFEVEKGESQDRIQRRALLISAMTLLGRSVPAIATAELLAEREREDPLSIDANLAGILVAVAARFGDAARYQAFVETFLRRRDLGAPPQHSLRYLHSLSMFRQPGAVQRTLGLIDEGTIPQESVGSVLSQLLSARHSQEEAWEHLKTRWSDLCGKVGDMGLSRLLESLGHLPARRRADIVEFFERHPPKKAERALGRALEALDQREELRARITDELLEFFR